MQINSSKFYCPWCKITFSQVDKSGKAFCPCCGRKRTDGLNQTGENHFACIKCGCAFSEILKDKIKCPNGCND